MWVHLIEVEKALTISTFLKNMQKRSEEGDVILILDSKVNFKLTFFFFFFFFNDGHFTPVRAALHQDWAAALVSVLLLFSSPVPFN